MNENISLTKMLIFILLCLIYQGQTLVINDLPLPHQPDNESNHSRKEGKDEKLTEYVTGSRVVLPHPTGKLNNPIYESVEQRQKTSTNRKISKLRYLHLILSSIYYQQAPHASHVHKCVSLMELPVYLPTTDTTHAKYHSQKNPHANLVWVFSHQIKEAHYQRENNRGV